MNSAFNEGTLSGLNIRRGIVEKFNEKTQQENRQKEIEKLDAEAKITNPTEQDKKMIQKCLTCNEKSYNHMNRHFCSPECATSRYFPFVNNNPYKQPYKPSGGKTKRKGKRIKQAKTKRKGYKKQHKKKSRRL
jgi:hypothetical protein